MLVVSSVQCELPKELCNLTAPVWPLKTSSITLRKCACSVCSLRAVPWGFCDDILQFQHHKWPFLLLSWFHSDFAVSCLEISPSTVQYRDRKIMGLMPIWNCPGRMLNFLVPGSMSVLQWMFPWESEHLWLFWNGGLSLLASLKWLILKITWILNHQVGRWC